MDDGIGLLSLLALLCATLSAFNFHLNIPFFLGQFQCHSRFHFGFYLHTFPVLDIFRFDLDLLGGLESISKGPQVCREEHAMSPTGFFAPEVSEVVANSIVGRLGQGLVGPLAETVISLCNLPDFPFN